MCAGSQGSCHDSTVARKRGSCASRVSVRNDSSGMTAVTAGCDDSHKQLSHVNICGCTRSQWDPRLQRLLSN